MFREINESTSENEQSSEDIKEVLVEAIKNTRDVLILQKLENGEEVPTTITPTAIKGWLVLANVEGSDLPIELAKIIKAEIIE